MQRYNHLLIKNAVFNSNSHDKYLLKRQFDRKNYIKIERNYESGLYLGSRDYRLGPYASRAGIPIFSACSTIKTTVTFLIRATSFSQLLFAKKLFRIIVNVIQ